MKAREESESSSAAARASGGGALRATNEVESEAAPAAGAGVAGSGDLSRRDAIKLGLAAATLAGLDACGRVSGTPATAKTAGRFFTAPEFDLADELSEMIIPADEHSPGARAAKVAAFIDGQLAEAWDEKDRATWRDGLALVDRISQETHAKPFMQASAEQRTAVLTRLAQNEGKPQKPEELFFAEVKGRVVHAYYTSEIGMKQEMEYKGNVFLQDFVGEDVSRS